MEIGIHLPSAQPGATAEGIARTATEAERAGFDAVWMFDHLFTPAAIESKYPYTREGDYPMSADDPFFDPIGLYGVLAGTNDRIKLGTDVLIGAYRSPVVLGKILATIENFAPGRIILGLGAGWMREEFEATGVDYSRRAARADEYIDALRAVWSGRSSFDGDFYQWVDAGLLPSPTQPLPILVGGHGDRALKRAATKADGWAAMTTREQGAGIEPTAARIEVLKGHLADAGRTLDGFEILFSTLLWFSDHTNHKLPLTGPPEHVAESIKRLGDIGITMIDLIVFGPDEAIVENAALFAEEVRPLL